MPINKKTYIQNLNDPPEFYSMVCASLISLDYIEENFEKFEKNDFAYDLRRSFVFSFKASEKNGKRNGKRKIRKNFCISSENEDIIKDVSKFTGNSFSIHLNVLFMRYQKNKIQWEKNLKVFEKIKNPLNQKYQMFIENFNKKHDKDLFD
jgi:hypothetical protein